MELDIKATTVTPLCQIYGVEERQIAGNTAKTNVTAIQTLPFFIKHGEDTKSVKIPVFTGNGFRGNLRRQATKLLIDKALEKGHSLGKNSLSVAKSFHAMNAGSSVTYTNVSFDKEDEIRALNPVVSLLGTSLAISGKIAVSPLVPRKFNTETGELEHYVAVSSNNHMYSTVTSMKTSYKKDDIINNGIFSAALGEEVHKDWEQLVKDSKDNSEASNLGAGHVLTHEEISSGVDMYGSIIPSAPLTDIEKGLLLTSLINLTKKPLGALSASGRGKMDFTIVINGRSHDDNDGVIRTSWNEYGSRVVVNADLSKKAQGYIDSFNEWLEDLSEESIQVEKILTEFELTK